MPYVRIKFRFRSRNLDQNDVPMSVPTTAGVLINHAIILGELYWKTNTTLSRINGSDWDVLPWFGRVRDAICQDQISISKQKSGSKSCAHECSHHQVCWYKPCNHLVKGVLKEKHNFIQNQWVWLRDVLLLKSMGIGVTRTTDRIIVVVRFGLGLR